MSVTDKEGQGEFPAVDPLLPVIFLGVADGVSTENPATPFEALSLFQLSRVKRHFAFPIVAKQARWCFLFNLTALLNHKHMRIELLGADGSSQANFNTTLGEVVTDTEYAARTDLQEKATVLIDKGQWLLQVSNVPDLFLKEPGEYKLVLHNDGRTSFLGRALFVFSPPPPLTEEQISALESDPVSPKSLILTIGCKLCGDTIKIYTATKKTADLEADGAIYYLDLPEQFVCKCAKTSFSLTYLRTGMHGFLNRSARALVGDISYVQRYAHSQLLEIASKFLALVHKENKEQPIQQFLEKHKVLFARFHAKRLFTRPRILGRFNADFAILDSEGILTLIEIERPTIRLFKSNGHLRTEFNHAYEQVQDWLNEVLNHRFAVIEGLGLKHDEVLSIRGCVIAGRAKAEKREHLRRHMSQPRANIDFLTLDMLADSLVQIASDLP